ncbi:FAD dependent oxidoreductase [Echria macrotheca]|uniref:FAD dependent oxidoreductase n=1 Tax=Echria macrotheca TaxID=438768 RepID=A0AAJ0BKF6_9PEZI|nr:FAD dependent oxidoreductase [Echria macrotheca]
MSSTVILGAGIIGVSTAYYLSDHQPPSTIHLVDPSSDLFSSASGFAGGFLAKDWFAPRVLPLGKLSFELHRNLADEYAGAEKWGYSPTTSVSYTRAAETTGAGKKKRGDDWLRHGTSRAEAAPEEAADEGGLSWNPPWLRRVPGDEIEIISGEGTTAQVDPLLLCRFLLDECLKRGVRLHHPATVSSVSADLRGELASVRIADGKSSTETDLPCTRLIITAGVWSGQVFRNLFRHSKLDIPVMSLAGHSLVLKSPRWKGTNGAPCHAVYTTHGAGFSPEIYARTGGHVYIAGLNSTTIPLQDAAEKASVHAEAITALKETAKTLLGNTGPDGSAVDDLEIVREGLCFRPVTPSGLPIIGRIPDQDLGVGISTRPGADGGVFIATGHGPWGISMSLGTGTVLAEMAQGRPLSADISGLGLE